MSGWIVIALVGLIVMFLISHSLLLRERLDSKHARALVDSGAKLVDVRSSREFQAGHLQGALHLPLDHLEAHVHKKLPSKETPLIVYCRSGARSVLARQKLKALGYHNVHDLGAISNW